MSGISTARWIGALLLAILYLISHWRGVMRELSLEEGVFIQPGLNLFLGRGFYWDWGELEPQASPFHKPPLLSLLSGGLAWLTDTVDWGPKLLPFLIGLWVVLLPGLMGGSWVPGLLLLVSPFFMAASGQVQTDPTVGLLGYGMIVMGLGCLLRQPEMQHRSLRIWSAGLIILWLGKVEIAVIATAVSVIALLLMTRSVRRIAALWLACTTVLGVSLLCVAAGILGESIGLNWETSISEIFSTITRIVGETVTSGVAKPGRRFLLMLLFEYQMPQLALLLLLPSFIAWRFLSRSKVFYLIAATVPMLAYMAVGYTGDGFPRYFLIAFPSLALLAAESISELDRRRRALVGMVMIGGAMACLTVPAWYMFNSANSPVIRVQTHGFRESAQRLSALTRSGDLVVIPEPCFLYLKDRRSLVIESFVPYPVRAVGVFKRSGEIRGIIVHSAELYAAAGVMPRLVAELRSKPHVEFSCGSFVVLARTPEP